MQKTTILLKSSASTKAMLVSYIPVQMEQETYNPTNNKSLVCSGIATEYVTIGKPSRDADNKASEVLTAQKKLSVD